MGGGTNGAVGSTVATAEGLGSVEGRSGNPGITCAWQSTSRYAIRERLSFDRRCNLVLIRRCIV